VKAFIAVKNSKGLDSEVDDRFGRAGYFIIYDLDNDAVLSVEANQHKNGAQGVGIAVGNQILKSGCQLAIGAQPGPKAENIMKLGKIEFFKADNCTVAEAIKGYRQSKQ
jgi:predicted Fe-Mo cluster-binding NifX family protein